MARELVLREMNDRQALYSENDSEPQTGIEPATFWWLSEFSLGFTKWATKIVTRSFAMTSTVHGDGWYYFLNNCISYN